MTCREGYDMPCDKMTVDFLEDAMQNYYSGQWVRVLFQGKEYWVEDIDPNNPILIIGAEVKE